MTKQSKEIIGLTFQEIPLQDALQTVLVGDGTYAELKQTLLERLPNLAPDKAFAFGVPNGKEVPKEQRRGLCMAINATLKKAKLNWRVTYSGTRKLFICVPRSSKPVVAKSGDHVPRSKWNNDPILEKKILALHDEGLSVAQIVKKGFELQRVKYLCYQKFPRNQNPPKKSSSKIVPTLSDIIDAAVSVSEEIDRLAITDRHDSTGRDFRKAIQAIATRDYKIDRKEVGKAFGVSGDAVTFNLKTAFKVEPQINLIRKTLASNRIKNGIAHAKENGVRMGRPEVAVDKDQIKVLYAQGMSHRKIAQTLGMNKNKVGQILGGN